MTSHTPYKGGKYVHNVTAIDMSAVPNIPAYEFTKPQSMMMDL